MQTIKENLLKYIENLIYNPEKAELDSELFCSEYSDVLMGFQYLRECILENKQFMTALSKGDLSCKLPSVENMIASSAKALHGSLKHMTWQTQQVAKGDYNQRVDFMGEFSDSFNEMVMQLDHRTKRLLQTIDDLEQRNKELVQMQGLVNVVVQDSDDMFIVVDNQSNEVYLMNDLAKTMDSQSKWLMDKLLDDCREHPVLSNGQNVLWETSYIVEDNKKSKTLFYKIESYAVSWNQHVAVAHVIEDVTQAKNKEIELKRFAFQDPLTNCYNRRYGMAYLEELIEQQEAFAISMVDIDYLKLCNDVYGHEEGNKYITLIVEVLQQHLEKDAIICRIGGDEFLLIHKDNTTEAVNQVLQQARMYLENIPTTLDMTRSFSYGSCTYSKEMTQEQLLAEADMKMYQNKVENKKRLSAIRKITYKDDRLV